MPFKTKCYKVGNLNLKTIDKLNIKINNLNKAIFIGINNIKHIKAHHLGDYLKYGNKLREIIKKPNYISKNPRTDSIEYIKIFDNNYVKVVVRPTKNGILFVRTLFVMSEVNVKKYLAKNKFLKFG